MSIGLLINLLVSGFSWRTFADSTPYCQSVTTSQTAPFIPTTGTIRVLIVFVQFQDDTFDTPSCIADPTNGWPSSLHTIPNWATGNNLVHSATAPSYTSGSLSHFYDVMSNGSFDFIGDVYPQLYLTPQPKSYYDASQGRGRGWLNQQIIDWMNPNVNFANYDNDNDGDVDMILFIYRNWDKVIFGANFGGIADLGFSGSIVRDGKTIKGGFPGSGTTQNNVYRLSDCWGIGAHEISHYQFGGDHFDYTGKFGIHDGLNGSAGMSGYERLLLSWINPTVISSNTSITVTDAITTSNYYRINIPSSDEYFLLENRQALSIYEQSVCLYTGVAATGLMIAHIRPSASKIDQIRWEAADNTFLFDDPGQATDSYKPSNKVQFTSWTKPNSDRSNGNFTGIAVTNINQSVNNITADIVLNFSSGTLTENSWWEGAESITGNVTLNSGKTLTVTPNTTVTFSSGTSLTVNGSLVANSTSSSQRITFTRQGTSGSWNGIKINSGSSSNVSTLRRCDVQYATDGISITYTGSNNSVTIDKCRIRYNLNEGIYVLGNGSGGATVHPTISNNTISDNGNNGISLANYAVPTITGNRIENNLASGIYTSSNNSATVTYNYIYGNDEFGLWLANSSYVQLHRNTIKANSGRGVNTVSNSNLTAYGNDNTKGRNEITANSGIGIYAGSSAPIYGKDVSGQYGNNWIHDNTRVMRRNKLARGINCGRNAAIGAGSKATFPATSIPRRR
jgi:M6 family metalloprotease-like protein